MEHRAAFSISRILLMHHLSIFFPFMIRALSWFILDPSITVSGISFSGKTRKSCDRPDKVVLIMRSLGVVIRNLKKEIKISSRKPSQAHRFRLCIFQTALETNLTFQFAAAVGSISLRPSPKLLCETSQIVIINFRPIFSKPARRAAPLAARTRANACYRHSGATNSGRRRCAAAV